MVAHNKKYTRRQLLMATASGAAIAAATRGTELFAQNVGAPKRYIFVICASGGASIIDSFLAQATGPAAYTNLVQVSGSAFAAAPVLQNSIQGAIPLGNSYAQATFLQKHTADTVVMTAEVSSVNHIIAARRAMSGDNTFGGRTIAEAVAMEYGRNLLIPNLMMAGGGYGQHGDDGTVSESCRAQFVSDPLMFALATHGYKGLSGVSGQNDIRAARALRKQLENVSRYTQTFKDSRMMDVYLKNRERVVDSLEQGDTISKLLLLDPASENLSSLGLQMSPDMATVRAKFPSLATDSYEARLALGFLAAKSGLSNAITIAPSQAPLITAQGSPNPPLAFDWSHVDHRGAQNSMWSYILKGVDALIDLLKTTDVAGDPSQGKMWDRSLIYIASEFGRDKVATGGSGHHLNNGVVMISPLLQGNKIYGGIDIATATTYGFDPTTGAPDPNRKMKEKHIYGAIAQALGINYDGRSDYSAMVRKA